ncbi:hypothetical protein [Lysinibacillus sp. NPDC059133]
MNIKDENNDYIPEAARCTLAFVLATLLILGIFAFKAGKYRVWFSVMVDN